MRIFSIFSELDLAIKQGKAVHKTVIDRNKCNKTKRQTCNHKKIQGKERNHL